MSVCRCLVQQGQISPEAQACLRADMAEFAQRHFGGVPDIQWTVVGKGDGFTDAQPSNSVIISMPATRALPPSEREPLLRALGDIWTAHTDLTGDEVVTVITDPPT